VLISTGRYRALASVPAVIARPVITGELRDRLGFAGVVMTDDLDVQSLSSFGTPAELGVRATLAGADLLVFAHQPADIEAEITAITHAVQTGRVLRTMLVASAQRILALRADLTGGPRRASPSFVETGAAEDQRVAELLAREYAPRGRSLPRLAGRTRSPAIGSRRTPPARRSHEMRAIGDERVGQPLGCSARLYQRHSILKHVRC
jgi:beta-glucosidase-like glycosyl hydrolase